jgi:hypothetical protein
MAAGQYTVLFSSWTFCSLTLHSQTLWLSLSCGAEATGSSPGLSLWTAVNSLVPGFTTHSSSLYYNADMCSRFLLSQSFTWPSCLAIHHSLMWHLAKYSMAAFSVKKPENIMLVILTSVTLLLVGTENTFILCHSPEIRICQDEYVSIQVRNAHTHIHAHTYTYTLAHTKSLALSLSVIATHQIP